MHIAYSTTTIYTLVLKFSILSLWARIYKMQALALNIIADNVWMKIKVNVS